MGNFIKPIFKPLLTGLIFLNLSLFFMPNLQPVTTQATSQVFAVGTDNHPYYWTGSAWQLVSGTVTSLAMDTGGNLWAAYNGNVQISKATDTVGSWQVVSGTSNKLASGVTGVVAGQNGTVWAICNNIPYLWTGSDWQKFDGLVVSLAITSDGQGWCIGTDGNLYLGASANKSTSSWGWVKQSLPVDSNNNSIPVSSVVVGLNNQILTVGSTTHSPYLLLGAHWQPLDGGVISLAVTSQGLGWSVGNDYTTNGNPYVASYTALTQYMKFGWVTVAKLPLHFLALLLLHQSITLY